MKIKMRTTAAGPDGCLQSDKVYEVPSDFGQALVNGEYAIEIQEPKSKELQSVEPEAPKPEEAKAKGKK